MKIGSKHRIALLVVGTALLVPAAMPQIGKLIKIIGIVEVTKRFGNDINKGFNDLVKRDPKSRVATKVVPILTGGVGSRNAVGMVQVSGPKAQVDKVRSVAQLEQDLFGREIRIRALVPIEGETILDKTVPVPEVGVTGIVDLKL
jgi:hypothetical protein